MERAALFIDAGYLLAAGAELCLGSPNRAGIECQYADLVKYIADFTKRDSGLPLLRTYWYDAAPVESGGLARPTADQVLIATLPNLKLRLGRLNRPGGGKQQQKGVDSLLMRDLITLAHERAVATMYVVSGDEDMREGVIAAQDMGVQVALIGIDGKRNNQSLLLVNECDSHHILTDKELKPFFKAKQTPAAVPLIKVPAGPTVSETARNIGRAYCDTWFAAVTREAAESVLQALPRVPSDIDAAVMKQLSAALGDNHVEREFAIEARRGFGARLREVIATSA